MRLASARDSTRTHARFSFIISDKMNEVWKPWAEMKWTSAEPIGIGSTMHSDGVSGANIGNKWDAKVTEFVKNGR